MHRAINQGFPYIKFRDIMVLDADNSPTSQLIKVNKMRRNPRLNQEIINEIGPAELFAGLQKNIKTAPSALYNYVNGKGIQGIERRQEIQKVCERLSPGITSKFQFMVQPEEYATEYAAKPAASNPVRDLLRAYIALSDTEQAKFNLITSQL